MHRKIAMTIMALSLGGVFMLNSPPAAAQQDQQQDQKKDQGKSRGGSQNATPHTTRRTVTQHKAPTTDQGAITKRKTYTAKPRASTRRKVHTATPKYVAPKGALKSGSQGDGKRIATAGRLRGAASAKIRGHNFSVWRSKHRVRHGNGFRTFVALSTLGAIMYGSDDYYPYAYLSATEPYCEGLTDDGCLLRWREVETLEGDSLYQCVAYCPWQ